MSAPSRAPVRLVERRLERAAGPNVGLGWLLLPALLLVAPIACRSAGTSQPDCVSEAPGSPRVSCEERERLRAEEAELEARLRELEAQEAVQEANDGAPDGNDAGERGGVNPGEEAVEPVVLKNTLRWKTASEVDNFGFDVYRGLSEDGPFERLTTEPIPGAVTTDEPQSYVFEDDTIEPGLVYWYYVESISMAGVREKFTPVFAAKAKGVPELEGE